MVLLIQCCFSEGLYDMFVAAMVVPQYCGGEIIAEAIKIKRWHLSHRQYFGRIVVGSKRIL